MEWFLSHEVFRVAERPPIQREVSERVLREKNQSPREQHTVRGPEPAFTNPTGNRRVFSALPEFEHILIGQDGLPELRLERGAPGIRA